MNIMQYAPEAIKNLFRPPATIKYPKEPYTYPEGARGHVEISIDDCIGCGMCVRACPSGALFVDREKGICRIEPFDCVACGYCVVKCPKKCLKMVPGYQTPGEKKLPAEFHKSEAQLEKERLQREEAARKAAEARQALAAKQAAGERQGLPAKKAAEAGKKEDG